VCGADRLSSVDPHGIRQSFFTRKILLRYHFHLGRRVSSGNKQEGGWHPFHCSWIYSAQTGLQLFCSFWACYLLCGSALHKLGEVKIPEPHSHSSIILTIYVPEIIKFGGDLTKFW